MSLTDQLSRRNKHSMTSLLKPRSTATVRTTYANNPSRALPPSKIAPRKPRVDLAEGWRGDAARVVVVGRNSSHSLCLAEPVLVAPVPSLVLAETVPVPTAAAAAMAPMKHRLQNKSDSEILTAVEARQHTFSRKYAQHCQKLGIPYPDVSLRETAHLDTCHTCQLTWPLFLYEQHYVCKHALTDVTRAWGDLPEYERVRLHKLLTQADRKWLKAMIKKRTASSFQLFAKDAVTTQPDLMRQLKSMKERSMRLAAWWKAQPPEVVQNYKERARQLKVTRANQMASMPEFKKKQVARVRRAYMKVMRESHPPKPPNPYMLFQKDQWQQESQKPSHMEYRDFVKVVAQRWRADLTDEQKRPYVDAAQVQRTNYFVHRDAASARLKAAKQQKRHVQKTMALQRKRRRTTATPHADEDHGSDSELEPFDDDDQPALCDLATPRMAGAGDLTFPRVKPPSRPPSKPVSPPPSTTQNDGREEDDKVAGDDEAGDQEYEEDEEASVLSLELSESDAHEEDAEAQA